MTERFEPTRSTERATTAADADGPTHHLAGAYSPRWLSGPSHYEGLVATIAPDDHDPHGGQPDDPGADSAGTPA